MRKVKSQSPCPSEMKPGIGYFRIEDRFCESKGWYQRLRSFFKTKATDGTVLAESSNYPAAELLIATKLTMSLRYINGCRLTRIGLRRKCLG